MAGNLTNFMGDLSAFGKMSCLGSALTTTCKSQRSDTSNAETQASQSSGDATANESNTDALLQKSEQVVDTMSPNIVPESLSPNGSDSAGNGVIDAERFEIMLGNSKMFSQVQTDVGQVKNEIQSINDNMAGILSVQQQGFSRLENMLASLSSGQARMNAMGFLSDVPAAMAITDVTCEDHTSSAYAFEVEKHSQPFDFEGAHREWSAFDQLVDDGLVEQEYIEAKRFGQELALDSEDEKDRKEQAELDEYLTQEAQQAKDAVFLPFVEGTMEDPEITSVTKAP